MLFDTLCLGHPSANQISLYFCCLSTPTQAKTPTPQNAKRIQEKGYNDFTICMIWNMSLKT